MEDRNQTIIKLLEEGYPYRTVAERTGVSRTTVMNVARTSGLRHPVCAEMLERRLGINNVLLKWLSEQLELGRKLGQARKVYTPDEVVVLIQWVDDHSKCPHCGGPKELKRKHCTACSRRISHDNWLARKRQKRSP